MNTQANFVDITLQFWFRNVSWKKKKTCLSNFKHLLWVNNLSHHIFYLQSCTTLVYDNSVNLNLYGIGNAEAPMSLSCFSHSWSNQGFIGSKIIAMFVQLTGSKTLLLSDVASFATMDVKAQAACTIYLKCMTVRIIAMSNPLGLQYVPVRLMHDKCQGDKRSCHNAESEMKLGNEFKYLFAFSKKWHCTKTYHNLVHSVRK